MNKILVINAGSSSIKFKLLDYDSLEVVTSGLCESIGVNGHFKINYNGQVSEKDVDFPNQEVALSFMLDYLLDNHIINSKDEIVAVGHRIVHGSTVLTESCIVGEREIKIIDDCTPLAPLHIPPELLALKILQKLFDKSKQVAVFDTSFHKTIPYQNYMYGVKNEWLEKYNVRRFGFHGISYQYVTEKMEEILGKKNLNLIICHLGNGSSICAVKNSKSINTSMGFTPTEGLIMGTRTGDIGPDIISYMTKNLNKSYDEVLNMCIKESGIKGLTGYSDMRDLEANLQNEVVKKGFDVFVKRIVNYIAIYLNDLENQLDALVFSGGIGENSFLVREAIINQLHVLNAELNQKLNLNPSKDFAKISTSNSKNDVYIVNTNEELMIAKEVKKLV